jgi:N-acetylneuraminic acid mutarotase
MPRCRPRPLRQVSTAAALCVLALLIVSACQHESLSPQAAEPGSELTVAGLTNRWAAKAPLPTGRVGLVAAAVDGMIYAIGGADHPWDGSGRNLRIVEGYSPSAKLWFYVAPLPAARAYANGAAVINGKIYVTGGLNQPQLLAPAPTRTLFVYNPEQNAWTRKADLPVASFAGASAAINGKVYVAVGGQVGKDEAALYRYDPGTNAWTKRASPPHKHFSGVAAAINGKLYVAGGLVGGKTELGDLDVYDPGTNAWTSKAPMPTPRHSAVGRVINGKLYVAGGSGNGISNRLEVYNPATNIWVQQADLPSARAAAGGAVAGGVLYVIGGADPLVSTANETYTP